mgnify:CR=1 FL=1
MSKRIVFNDEARGSLHKGMDAVANAVRTTIGPRGRNVVLGKSYGGPTITNDGVSIAKEIELEDPIENMGAQLIKEVATKTNEAAGDGTSTATVLMHAIVSEGMKHTARGVNAMALRHGIEQAREDVVAALKEMAVPVHGNEEIKQVATISAESEEIGTIIAETIEKVGHEGVVTVEESQSLGVDSEVVEGMEFDKGYVSAYMVTDTDRMEAVYKDAAVLITDQKVASVKEILPLLENLAQTGTKDLVIIADDIEGEALTTFVVNKLRGGFNVLGIKAPGFGDRKKEVLADIAVTLGGTVVSKDTGLTLDTVGAEVLGKASRIVATKDKTVIVGGKGDSKAIDTRVAQLKTQLANTDSKFDKEKLQERIGKLSGGVAVIKVGAATETEMKYLKLKIEDAVNATKAAIEEGIVAGGGSALAKVAGTLAEKADKLSDEGRGYQTVVNALVAPLRQIAVNAGKDNGAVVIDKVMAGGKRSGYDAGKDAYVEDMLKAGIVDPVKVTRSAIEHAASAAAIFLTTEVAIVEEPKDEPSMPGGMPGMM